MYERIDRRIDQMLEMGLVEEVQGLLDQGYSPDLPSLSAIGYREIVSHLLGEIALDEAVILIKRTTRQYVRRQANWFKLDDPAIHWFQAGTGVIEEIENLAREWLARKGWLRQARMVF